MANVQDITIKFGLDTTEFRKAEASLSSLTDEERKLKQEAAKAGQEIEQQADKIVASNRKHKRSIDELQREYKTLKTATRSALDPKKAQEYKKALSGIESEMQGINKQALGANKSIGGLKSVFAGLGGALVAGLALDQIISAVGAFAELENQIAQTRGTIARFSNTQGQTLDDLTAKVRALASTYGIAEEQLTKIVNAFSKQTQTDFVTSLDLIEKGFLQVGTAGGEFADSIREYSKLLIDAGATAEEVVKIAAIQDLEGVFNDKLIDSIFNFSNELKDTQKATKALANTFGSEFATKAIADFRSGSATALDILKRVGEEAERTGKSTIELAEITTDLGTGVAEDIGGILEVYRLYNKALDLNVNNLDDLGKRQQRVLETSKAYEASIIRLTQNFEGFGASVTEATKTTTAFFADIINGMFEAQRIYDEVNGNIKKEVQSTADFVNSLTVSQLGDEIEKAQNDVNNFASSILQLRNNYNLALSAGEKAGESTKQYKDRLQGLSMELVNTKSEFEKSKEKLDLLIKAKENAITKTDNLATSTKKEGVAFSDNTGIIAKLRVQIQEATKAREEAVSEGQITRLNKRLELLNKELQILLSLKDAKKADSVAEVESLEVGRQVSNELLETELGNIEKLKTERKIEKQDFYQDQKDKRDFAINVFQEIASASANLLNALADLRQASLEQELSELKKATEARIELAGNNEKAIEQIKAEAAKKEEAILKKQGEARKNAQIQQAIIAGLQGVVQATARADLFPFNFVLAGLVAGATALNIAAIKKTPAYKDGTEYVEGPGTATSDSINARLSKGERVVSASVNGKLGGFPNADLPKAVAVYSALKDFAPAVAVGVGSSDNGANIEEAIKRGFSAVTIEESNYNEKGYSKYRRSKDSRVRVIDENNSL